MVTLLLATAFQAIAILATICTVIISPKRTYYPLLRIIFALVAGVYQMSAVAQLLTTDAHPNPTVRVIGAGSFLLALAWCVQFVRRRNRFPQFVIVNLRGLPEEIDPQQVENAALMTLSLIRHGAATPELVERAREAVATYDDLTAWKNELAGEAERRKRRKGIPEEGS